MLHFYCFSSSTSSQAAISLPSTFLSLSLLYFLSPTGAVSAPFSCLNTLSYAPADWKCPGQLMCNISCNFSRQTSRLEVLRLLCIHVDAWMHRKLIKPPFHLQQASTHIDKLCGILFGTPFTSSMSSSFHFFSFHTLPPVLISVLPTCTCYTHIRSIKKHKITFSLK